MRQTEPGLWLWKKESHFGPNVGQMTCGTSRSPGTHSSSSRASAAVRRTCTRDALSSVRFSFQGPRGAEAPTFKEGAETLVAGRSMVKRLGSPRPSERGMPASAPFHRLPTGGRVSTGSSNCCPWRGLGRARATIAPEEPHQLACGRRRVVSPSFLSTTFSGGSQERLVRVPKATRLAHERDFLAVAANSPAAFVAEQPTRERAKDLERRDRVTHLERSWAATLVTHHFHGVPRGPIGLGPAGLYRQTTGAGWESSPPGRQACTAGQD